MLKEHLERMFDHVNWANNKILQQLQLLTEPLPKPIHLFTHVLSAEKVWLTRLNGEDRAKLSVGATSGQIDGEPLIVCEQWLRENREDYNVYFAHITEQDLLNVIAYRNTQGILHHTSVIDILTHVSEHGSYHRGQICSYLRSQGYEPVNTDYITFTRD
ncbi:MAG: damage-inducible protein DinB [Gorillibacterium sp.]|nr:damage-inducible protein DinB [Gorillibacterium sp.]